MFVQCPECKAQLQVDAEMTGSPLCRCAKCKTVFYVKYITEFALLQSSEPKKGNLHAFFYIGIILGGILLATAGAGFFAWPAGFICIGIAICFLLMNELPYRSKLKIYNEKMAASENRLKSSAYRESIKNAVGTSSDVLKRLDYYCQRYKNESGGEDYIHETVLHEPKPKEQKAKKSGAVLFFNKNKNIIPNSHKVINNASKPVVANKQPTDSKQIYCHKCGATLFDDSEFCHKCGAELHNK